MRVLTLICVLLMCTNLRADDPMPDPPPADDAELQQDYAAIEGTWRRRFRDSEGREIFAEKKERDGKSMVTYRDVDGKVLHSHQSEYKLERTGQVRVFLYWNRTVTEGPDKGLFDPRPRSYIYRVHNDRFFEIHGVLLEDQRAPNILIWERVADQDGRAA